MMKRIVVLDTETTGLNKNSSLHYEGHRVIEIGAIEVINRKITGQSFHTYLKPDRLIEQEAIKIHGITDEKLTNAPTFQEIHQEFISFIKNSILVIHNAPFDLGFLNYEFSKLSLANTILVEDLCEVLDTLKLARQIYPGKRNSLDALCDRLMIDNSSRTFHGALLDAELLAKVYIAMTGGQINLFNDSETNDFDPNHVINSKTTASTIDYNDLRILHPTTEESELHKQMIELIKKNSSDKCLWAKD